MKKNIFLTGLLALLFLLSICLYFDFPMSLFEEKVISIGVFSDSYWQVQNGYAHKILNDAIEKFEKEHPGVIIKYESGILKEDYSNWLSDKIISNNCPDIFVVLPDDLNDLSEANILQDLSQVYKKDEGFDEKVFYDTAFMAGQYKGVQYALPYECAPKLMLVNKTILDELDIEMPDNDWTWSDLYEICLKINESGYYPLAGYSWLEAFTSNKVYLFDEEGQNCDFVAEGVYEAIVFLDMLNKSFNLTSVDSSMFEEGEVAFEPLSFAQYRAYKPYPLSVKKFSNFDLQFITMPKGPDGDNISQLDTVLLAMNKNCSDKDLAFEFMKVLCCDKDIQKEIFYYSEGISPVVEVTNDNEIKELLSSSSINTDIIDITMKKSYTATRFKDSENAYKQVDSAVSSILKGSGNIKTEQIIYNRKINAYLSE